MPRQNRVDPWGNIVAHPARGMLMGNRGCLHDDDGRIVRTSDRTAWITCLPTWPGVRRRLMAPRHYTELFFLDEATALAAGHRPCGSCRPEALGRFKRAWAEALGTSNLPKVAEMDHVLRSSQKDSDRLEAGPTPGLMASDGARALLYWQGRWLAWSFMGYVEAEAPAMTGPVITPQTMQAILRAGYVPLVHPTANML